MDDIDDSWDAPASPTTALPKPAIKATEGLADLDDGWGEESSDPPAVAAPLAKKAPAQLDMPIAKSGGKSATVSRALTPTAKASPAKASPGASRTTSAKVSPKPSSQVSARKQTSFAFDSKKPAVKAKTPLPAIRTGSSKPSTGASAVKLPPASLKGKSVPSHRLAATKTDSTSSPGSSSVAAAKTERRKSHKAKKDQPQGTAVVAAAPSKQKKVSATPRRGATEDKEERSARKPKGQAPTEGKGEKARAAKYLDLCEEGNWSAGAQEGVQAGTEALNQVEGEETEISG